MPTAAGLARARELYLKEEYPTQYNRMKADGTLPGHLETTGQEADEMLQDLVAQMRSNPDLPTEYGLRVTALEAIPEQVREMVYHDLINVAPPQK